jgi:hypothetical protein
MSKFKKLYNYPIDWDGDFYYPISDKNKKSDFYKILIYLIVLLFCIIIIFMKLFTL